MAEPRIIYEDEISRVATHGNLLLVAWWNAPQRQHVVQMRKAAMAIRTRYVRGCGTLNIIVEGTPRFSDEVRKDMRKLSNDIADTALGTAHVVSVEGLAGTATRTFLATVSLLSGAIGRTKVFAEIEPACRWLTPLLSKTGELEWRAEDLTDAGKRFVQRV